MTCASKLLLRHVLNSDQGLIDSLDDDLRYAIEVEGKWQMEDAANYEEVRDAIKAQLESLRDHPNRDETPLIYHLDVAAMYPNIILTNRPASCPEALHQLLPPMPLHAWALCCNHLQIWLTTKSEAFKDTKPSRFLQPAISGAPSSHHGFYRIANKHLLSKTEPIA